MHAFSLQKTNNDTLDRLPGEVLTDIRSLVDYSSVSLTNINIYPPYVCWHFLATAEKSASARKYHCSTSSGSIQGIVFIHREWQNVT